MLAEGEYDLNTGAGLIACPRCDALHLERNLEPGETARCVRCNTVLASPRTGAFTRIIALSFTALVLMVAAVFFPFLEISRMGFGNETSLFGVALAFSHGALLPLTVLVLASIVGLPVLRALLLVYTLLPLSRQRPPYAHAVPAFRLAEALRPWSMAEIFVIGTAVALVKVAGLANISFGPAFWAFCGLIVVNAASNAFTSATTIWDAIEDGGLGTDGREMLPEPRP
ncbi:MULTISPECIES: paraquat-inducible protein A [unclassified Paracoccus (in: a-proteobacteria)]|uniref:paraquat-inducible protein A n=1 Tax=unclassified Paracoccus (in: a-proteobacteria) TaxID=2688777 RepID=UPI0012B195FF|nr:MULTISPECIES: paraquat-inducible protein A [unclassified Paracoccus (in: a-proteobacteria)]UXU75846.1 paraquat-inducible protein A [Paracoccus sp. SMMA_5]UXU81755.1 paraquat-inducible protein A [Paracoccus sp. SMMA_5_TC]